MHIAPVVIVPHRLGPTGWSQALTALARSLKSHPGLPLTLRLPGAAVEHLSQEEGDLWAELRDSDVLWLAGGYSDPVLVTLPEEARAAQLRRERTAMEAAGVTARGVWIADAWAPDLVTMSTEEGHGLVALDAALVEGRPGRPGAVERAGETVTAVAVSPEATLPADPDGLVAIGIEADQLDDFARHHHGQLITPEAYLADHLPGPRLEPRTSTPRLPATAELMYRKVLLLTREMGDRGAGQDLLFGLQTREMLAEGRPARSDHLRLIAARATLDRSRHRGDSWVTVREVDWDADGVDEVHVETAAASLVIDPATATLDVWDDKAATWPLSMAASTITGTLIRRETEAGVELPAAPMRLERREEGRGEALLVLEGDDGSMCRVELKGRTLLIEITLAPDPELRVGPELPVGLERPRLRVDGGEWQEVDRPLEATGHRFRLIDDEHTLLVAAPRPCELFARPLPEGGVLIWPHWTTSEDSVYRLSLTPS